jgi:hypothetical protein
MDVYEKACKRIERFTIAVSILGALIALPVKGPLFFVGFLLGATLSLVNFYWWSGVARAIGSSGTAPLRSSAVFLVLRLLLFGGAIYAIVRVLKITPAALLAGLLVSLAAVIVEILYELTYGRT